MKSELHLREPDPDANYNAADDLRRSVEFAYEAIRARVSCGGRGWAGWPESAALDPTRTEEAP